VSIYQEEQVVKYLGRGGYIVGGSKIDYLVVDSSSMQVALCV
jgi:hypothetical protein